MSFRTSDFLQRYEMVEHRPEEVIRLPGNNQHQQKNGYKFNINNRSNLYDLYKTNLC